MTELRKICPNSGEKCDCPKGQCNMAVEKLIQGLNTSPEFEWPSEHEYASMKAYSDEVHAEQIANENEHSRTDRQEASSLKYALCAQILPLSSGKFALFGAYSIQEGIPLITINTWENLEPHVRAYRQTAEEGRAREQEGRKAGEAKAAADYDELFGEES